MKPSLHDTYNSNIILHMNITEEMKTNRMIYFCIMKEKWTLIMYKQKLIFRLADHNILSKIIKLLINTLK